MYPSPQRPSDPVEREREEPEAAGRAAQSCSSPRREDQASNTIRILDYLPGSGSMVGSDMYNLLSTVCEDQASNAIRIPQLFGLVGSGFWINHPDSGSMAGSDMFILLSTIREDQASNPIRISQILAWSDPDSRFIIPVPDPWLYPTFLS
jgi:hypothetical protein